ncbi:MAG: hypothetical protein C5B49_03855 [Bdellovibrio sp.]|nr:MAG: hypothetical protein C5B49_03855 [Bdellovibrio sp.]
MVKSTQKPLDQVVHRNIRALLEVRRREEAALGPQQRIARSIGRVVSRITFVYINCGIVLFWVVYNSGFYFEPFDPYPYHILSLLLAFGAILLTSFVLLAQDHLDKLSEKRADLDVQISLLTEQELTRLIQLTDLIAQRLQVSSDQVDQLEQMKGEIEPETLLHQIEDETLNFEDESTDTKKSDRLPPKAV